jgi:hypothetical protein
MTIEVQKSVERHTDGGCGGDVEIRIDHGKRKVTIRCQKCGIGSIVLNGKVVADGVPISLIEEGS